MILKGSWKGRGDLLNALRSVLAAEQAAEKAGMKERHQQERQQLREQYRPFPDFEHWLRQQQQPELADAWRYRAGAPQRINGDTTEPPTPRDIRTYTPKIQGQQVHYIRKDDATHAGQGGVASFVDKGSEIDIHDLRNRDCVLADSYPRRNGVASGSTAMTTTKVCASSWRRNTALRSAILSYKQASRVSGKGCVRCRKKRRSSQRVSRDW